MLRLEQVYSALAYYLAHREIIDAHLRKGAADFEHLRQATRDADPIWHQKLDQARRKASRAAVLRPSRYCPLNPEVAVAPRIVLLDRHPRGDVAMATRTYDR